MLSTDYFYGMSIFYAFSLKLQSIEVRRMKKLKRTSRFDSNLSSYLDEEKQAYVYEYIGLDENGKEAPMKQIIAITEENIEIIKILDEYDHYETLQNRYKKENEDVIIHKNITCNENGEHINLCKSLPQISRDNGNISIKALESRWAKIRKKAIKFFDIK